MPEFKAAVGLSRKWDAREAGREVAINTLNKLGAGVKPDFFLLFSTIHYEKWGGFKEFLKGVWDILPEGTPLIGGTVAGFMNNYGCYTRGATALAVNYPNMDVAVGVGHNTKRAPHLAAKECAGMIKKKLKSSKYKNKIFISLVSGGKVPSIPGKGQKRVIKNFSGIDKFLGPFISMTGILQVGPGHDEDVFYTLAKELNDYVGIGGTSCDELKLEDNTQFFLNNIFTNSIVSLAISLDIDTKVSTSYGLQASNKKFSITEMSGNGYVIDKINNAPAVEAYLRVMGWSRDVLDERLYRKVFYYPFASHPSGELLHTRMLGLVYGKKFICAARPTEDKEVRIYTSSGESILTSIESLVQKKYSLGVFISCGTRLETLGANSYKIKEFLDNKLKNNYLLLYTSGEFSKINETQYAFMYQSDNAILFS